MPHFFRAYDHTRRRFQEMLLNLAALTRQNLENAIKALLRQDNALANAVVAADDDLHQPRSRARAEPDNMKEINEWNEYIGCWIFEPIETSPRSGKPSRVPLP